LTWQLDAGADIYVSEEGLLGLPAGGGDITPVPAQRIAADAPSRLWALIRIAHRRVLTGGELARHWAAFLDRVSPIADRAEAEVTEGAFEPESPLEERSRLADAYERRAGKPAPDSWSRRRLRRELDALEEVANVQ
jgi:hypothetical protein